MHRDFELMRGRRMNAVLRFVVMMSIVGGPVASMAAPVSLALSGGGARGISHIGVLKALEELRIPVAGIAGTSVGSFVGGLYACGYRVDEIESVFLRTNWDDIIFNDQVSRRQLPYRRKGDFERYLFDFEVGIRRGQFVLPSGLIYGQKFSLLLSSLFLRCSNESDFSKLGIPFRAVASDLESGQPVIFRSGYLPDSVRASTAYPGFFSPVEIEGRVLLDGGSTNNLPVDIAQEFRAKQILAVDVSSPLHSIDKLSSFLDITDQIVTIMMRRTTNQQISKASFVVTPSLADESTFSYNTIDRLIQAGYDAVMLQRKTLSQLSVSEENYQNWQKARYREPYSPAQVSEIRIHGHGRVDPKTLLRQMSTQPHQKFDSETLEEDLTRIYSLGDFERTDFRFTKEENRDVLNIRAVEKRWGPNFVRFSTTWDGEIKGKQDGNATLNFRATRMNALNGEWNTDITLGTVLEVTSEFYQPIDYGGWFFLAPKFSAYRRDQDFYSDRNRLAQYEVDQLSGGVDLGLAIRNFGELRGGIRRGFLNSEIELGPSVVPTYDVQMGALVGSLRWDTLDSAYFPSRGYYLEADYFSSIDALGATDEYRKLYGQAAVFHSFRWLTLFLRTRVGGSLGSDLPLYGQYVLGGIQSFSGFREEELRGQNFMMGRAGLMLRLPIPRNPFWDRTYLVGWADTASIESRWADLDRDRLSYSGTGGALFDTKLGALTLAYGQSGTENRQFYVSVGRAFGFVDSEF